MWVSRKGGSNVSNEVGRGIVGDDAYDVPCALRDHLIRRLLRKCHLPLEGKATEVGVRL